MPAHSKVVQAFMVHCSSCAQVGNCLPASLGHMDCCLHCDTLHHAHLLPAVKSVLDRTKPASDNLWAKYNAMLHDPVVVSPLSC